MKPRLFDFPEWFPHESAPLKRFNNVRIRGDRALEAWNKTKITMVNDAFSHRYLFNKFLLEPYVNATSNARTLGTKILKQSMLENLCKVALERFSIECGKVIGFALSTRCDWLKRFAPPFHPIRSKTKANCDALACIFPRFASATCNYFEFWLVQCIVCVLCDWPE